MIFISTLAFVGFVTVKPYISYQYWNNHDDRTRRYSPARTYGKVSMYVMAVFTNHGKFFVQICRSFPKSKKETAIKVGLEEAKKTFTFLLITI